MALEGRRGLGRGLSALMGEAEAVASAPGAGGPREIPIELIARNPDQPRTDFAEAELEELAQSIRQRGVLQPILLRPYPGKAGEYQIVAGERRWRAAQRAGLGVLPAVVRELDDRQTLELALIENLQREDLNALEEATAFASLMTLSGGTQEDVAQAIGKSRSHVANTLRLLQLPGEVQALVRTGSLTAGHARTLIGAAEPLALAGEIIERGLSVRGAEALARKAAASGAARPARRKSTDTLALERDLSERLGLPVQITDKDGKGEIRIRYADLEQLDDLCRRLTR
ncbi:MAG TPA: ParB/RepB/Spo0J family partition protein [Caulobacteraceae bacterium]